MEKKYYPTIGLEIHAELKTQTKMFCACKNDPDEEKPNTNICPVCMAHPGALPIINKKAIENVIKVGLAVGGKIADFTEFDRKNYFYPDIPKGYQISQYKYPIVSGGHLADFDITRVHLEEDTANNKHDRGDFSLIDFNRSGVPLMELVAEAMTFKSDEEAAKSSTKFAKELQLILWYLGVSEANMEKGEMRVEANISISTDPKKLGTKVEVKNLNSFRSVERAIKYEVDRMIKLMEEGKISEIVQETRGWDDGKQKTFSQRKKEGSADYRYFPEPDLPKLKLHEAFSAKGGSASGGDFSQMRKELPELPAEKRARYKKDFGIKDEDVEVYINEPALGAWFEEITRELIHKEKIQIASNFITSDLVGYKKNNLEIKIPKAKDFADLICMYLDKKLTSRGTKDVLNLMLSEGGNPEQVAREHGITFISNEGQLKEIAQKIIDANVKVVADYKGGKEQALMSLVGQIMKETKGSANPTTTKQILIDLLK